MKPDARRLLSVDRAVQRYAAALRQGLAPCRADGKSASQTDNFRDATERAELRYAQIKEVLCDAGVIVCQFVVYRSFGLHETNSAATTQVRPSASVYRTRCYGGDVTAATRTYCRQSPRRFSRWTCRISPKAVSRELLAVGRQL